MLASGDWSPMRARTRQLAFRLLENVLGHLGLGDLRAVLLDHRALVLAELLSDRVELAAQDVLALLLVDAVSTSSWMRRRICMSARRSRCSSVQLEALVHVDGFEEVHLLLERDVG